jgi:hypothetical protein
MALDHRGQERLVVDVAGGPQAEPSLPLRIAQGLVRRELGRLHLLRVVHDGPRSDGEPEPAILRIPEVGRNVGGQLGRVDLRQKAGPRRVPEVAGVDREQDVGRGPVALGLEALEQLAGIAGEHLHRDPRLLGECFEGRLLAVMPRRVHEKLAASLRRTG